MPHSSFQSLSLQSLTVPRSYSVSIGCIGQNQPQSDGTEQQLAVWKQTAHFSVCQRPDITTPKSRENHDATLNLQSRELCACTLTGEGKTDLISSIGAGSDVELGLLWGNGYKSGHFLSLFSSLDPNQPCHIGKPFKHLFQFLSCPWAMAWIERKQQYPLLPAMPCKEDLFCDFLFQKLGCHMNSIMSLSPMPTTRGSFLGRVENKMEPGNSSSVA